MRSNYRRIGDFIELVDLRNKDLKIDLLLGLSISKNFIPSVANIVGTNMANYKIIKKNQFACSIMQVRRDKKMPVALLKDFDEAIISQAYPVFEILDKALLLPEYLMMWFSRSEFDRHACFLAVGGVRGSLEWEDFLDMDLPVPSIEKQRAIVKEYNTVVDRIQLNEQLNLKLEETAQAIYKHWFVDFEFPTHLSDTLSGGEGYKSSGGKMVWNEELDKEVPTSFGVSNIEEYVDILDGDRGRHYPSRENFYPIECCLFLNAGNVTRNGFEFSNVSFITKERDNLLRQGKLNRNDVILTTRGTVGNVAYYSDQIEYEDVRINSGMVILRCHLERYSIFIYSLMRSSYLTRVIENFTSGSAQPQLPIKDIKKMPIIIPKEEVIIAFSVLTEIFQQNIDVLNRQNRKLEELKGLILSKMSKVELEKEETIC